MSESNGERRRRWINLGELIAIAALMVSAAGVWIAWKSSKEDKTTRVVEQRNSVPLALRASVDASGDALTIAPADPAHALESLRLTIGKSAPIELGGDGRLSSRDAQSALNARRDEPKDRILTAPVKIDARYVEAGAERTGSGRYTLRYKWEGGGLFGGRSIKLLGLNRG